MHPLSDKDLDRMSREAAEHYDAEPSAAGWDNLERRLNKVMPEQKEKDRRRLLWWYMLPLLLMGGGLWWMLNNSGTQQTISDISSSQKINDSENSTNPELPNKTDNKDQIAGKQIETTRDDEKNNSRDESIAQKSSGNQQSSIQGNKRTRTNNQAPIIIVANKQDSKNHQKQKTGSLAADKGLTESADNDLSHIEPFSPNANLDNQQSTNKKGPASIVPLTLPTSRSNELASSTGKPKTKAVTSKQPLEIGFITGIDLSSIHSTSSNKPGYSVGLQAGYRFGKRLQVNTGFIFTRKNYTAKGEDFHPPKHYWTNYVELKDLEGYCEMWDIPINLRYYLSPGKSWEWFASVGASSYIMRKQQYDYNYYYNNQPAQRSWETNTQSNHWFGVLNLSAGFEKSISKTFSLQAEPYAKLAMAGVGYGSMDINSYGLMVGIKYKPILQKKSSATGNKMR